MSKMSIEAIVDNFKAEAKLDKAMLREVVLKNDNIVSKCYVLSKKANKEDIVSVRVLHGDDSVDSLTIHFVNNSLNINKVVSETIKFENILDSKVIASKEIKKLDLNKYSMSVGSFYVPLNVILTTYFRDKASSNIVFGKSVETKVSLVNEERYSTKKSNDRSGSFETTVMDICVYDENKKPINVYKVDDIEAYRMIGDNELFCDIFGDEEPEVTEVVQSMTAKDDTLEEETKLLQSVGNRIETIFNSEDIENRTKEILAISLGEGNSVTLMGNRTFRAINSLKSITTDTDVDGALLGQGIQALTKMKSMTDEEKVSFIIESSVNEEEIKNIKDMDIFKAQLMLLINKDNNKNTEEIKMKSVVDNNVVNDDMILNSVKVRLDAIATEYNYLKHEELVDLQTISLLLGETEFNTIVNEISFRTMNNMKVDTNVHKDTTEGAVILGRVIQMTYSMNNTDNEDALKDMILKEFKVTDDMDKVTNKDEFKIKATELLVMEKEETTKVHVQSIVEPEKVEESKEQDIVDKVEEIIVSGKVKETVYPANSMNMFDYITKKYKTVDKHTRFIETVMAKLEPKHMSELAGRNSNIADVINKYTGVEIKNNVFKGFETIREFLEMTSNEVADYKDILEVIKETTTDAKVKLVCNMINRPELTLENMTMTEKAKFYLIFSSCLKISIEDMVGDKQDVKDEFSTERALIKRRQEGLKVFAC